MNNSFGSRGLHRALALACCLALGGGLSGCVSKSKYNKALAANQACQTRVAEQEQRLGQLHASLMDLHMAATGTAANPDMRDEDIVAVLRTQLSDRDSELARYRGSADDALTYQLLAKYLFPSGSAKLTSQGEEALMKVATWLKESEANNIFVQGFTDDVPIGPNLKRKYASNWELSAHRATTVVRFLVDNGIPEERLIAVGYGEHHPEAQGMDEMARQQNRRIEIKLNNGEFKEVVARLPDTVPTDSLIDINRATVAELVVLPGVTPEFARAVVDYRQRAGSIATYDDLRQVRGFDEEKMGSLRTMVSFSGQRSYMEDTTGTDMNRSGTTGTDVNRSGTTGTDTGTDMNRSGTTGTDTQDREDMYLVPSDTKTDTEAPRNPKNTYPKQDSTRSDETTNPY